jgi:Zn-dependent M28 family amino/carboxypeptidase
MFLELKPATLAALLEQQGLDPTLASGAADAPMAITLLDGVTMEIDLAYETVAETTAPNVVGVLEGSDPQLKDEYLVYSAHMDHVGVDRAVNGDSIYNGADDDASGTIAVVELAEAFAKLHPRPKRSIIFLTVSGEEKGLWGSAHFAANPTVPMEQIVANLNADMVGRNWPDTIVVIGKEHSDLGETLNRVNAAHPELGMTAIDDIWPEENFYDRSDHINFARRGVPILFFFNGTHPDYHRPSDEVEKIDAEKEARIVQLMLYLGIDIANAAQRPKWNPESYEKIVSE